MGSFQAGASYYLGLSDEVTLGTGIVYDNSLKPYTQIAYQPVNVPLVFTVGALIGIENIKFNADVSYKTKNFSLGFGGDEDYQNFYMTYNLSQKFSLFSNWNPRDNDNGLEGGFNLNLDLLNLSLSYNTNNNINWAFRSRFDPFLFNTRKYNDQSFSELFYNLSGERLFTSTGHAIRLAYETNDNDYLGSLSWFYSTPLRAKDGRSLLDLEIGYGSGSQGSGIIASASTTIVPGLGLRLTYHQVSLDDDNSSFTLGLFSSLLLQPKIKVSPDDTQLDRLRTQGGIFLQPFLDKNKNGNRDDGEDFYTEDLDLLFLINNQPINQLGVSRVETLGNGALFELPPDNYRLDIDSAGFPIGWKAENLAYAVRVVAGTYTTVKVPLVPSYVLGGIVTDEKGKPIPGVRVEAVSVDNPDKGFTSVTNSAGIYYLEELQQGKYNLLIDGKPVQPNTIEINGDSKTFLELNLQLITNKKDSL